MVIKLKKDIWSLQFLADSWKFSVHESNFKIGKGTIHKIRWQFFHNSKGQKNLKSPNFTWCYLLSWEFFWNLFGLLRKSELNRPRFHCQRILWTAPNFVEQEMDVFRNFGERNELQNRDIKRPYFKLKNVIDDKSSKNFI